jgi:hypothetical protein
MLIFVFGKSQVMKVLLLCYITVPITTTTLQLLWHPFKEIMFDSQFHCMNHCQYISFKMLGKGTHFLCCDKEVLLGNYSERCGVSVVRIAKRSAW